MNLAYHIKDDRYDHVDKDERLDRLKKGISKRTRSLKRGVSNRTLAADVFDSNEWLVAIRRRLASLPAKRKSGLRRNTSVIGHDSLPPLTESNSSGFLKGIEASCPTDREEGDKPGAFALVGTDREGNVNIQWLNPLYKRKYINVAGVMNRATTVVTEFCPGMFFEW